MSLEHHRVMSRWHTERFDVHPFCMVLLWRCNQITGTNLKITKMFKFKAYSFPKKQKQK